MIRTARWGWWLLALTLVAAVVMSACSGQAATPAATATTQQVPTKVAAATQAAPTATTAQAAPTKAEPAATSAPSTSSSAIPVKGPMEGEAKQLSGAGATFPQPLYSKWFSEYNKLTGVEVNYQGIGSGGGIKGISDMTVDFGATDGPMNDDQLTAAKGGDVLHVPMALGAVGVMYNIPGVTKPLKFTGETLAGIYLGDITKWNDPKLLADNPDAGLPDKDIVVVHRSDGSGTSFIFTDYLSSVSEKWKSGVGKGTAPNWPVGLGGKGSPGVAGEVKQNEFSIGYVELIYALQNNISVALVKNQAGEFVEPNLASTAAAAAGVGDTIAPDLRASIVNAPGKDAYPIAGFTWLLVYKDQKDASKGLSVARLLWWAIHDGQAMSADLKYASLPAPIVKKAEEKILSMTANGKPILTQ